ncbi:MAG: hypothetical protein IPK69_13390 [Phycisphaerales bacterium]|nr:MAG: hypothetical protein IPK69_13390 [Phycisphaerales bacterium]
MGRTHRLLIGIAVLAVSGVGAYFGSHEISLRRQVARAKADLPRFRADLIAQCDALAPVPLPGQITRWTRLRDLGTRYDSILAEYTKTHSARTPGGREVYVDPSSIFTRSPEANADDEQRAMDAMSRALALGFMQTLKTEDFLRDLVTIGEAPITSRGVELADSVTDLSKSLSHFSLLRKLPRVNRARISMAIDEAARSRSGSLDTREILDPLLANVALIEAANSIPNFLAALVTDSMIRQNQEAALEIAAAMPSPALLDAVALEIDRLPEADSAVILNGLRTSMQLMVANHFADLSRVRRGMDDPAIEQLVDIENIGGEDEGSTSILGAYRENIAAINAEVDALIAWSTLDAWPNEKGSFEDRAPDLSDAKRLILDFADIAPRFVQKLNEARARRRITRLALALHRFEQRNGHFPKDLTELVPAWIDAIPIDPWSGRPMRYLPLTRTTGGEPRIDAFRIWSVGSDSIDNEGTTHIKPGVIDLFEYSGAGFDFTFETK